MSEVTFYVFLSKHWGVYVCVREVCTYGVWHMSVSERCIYVGNVPECEVCLCGVDAWKSMKSNCKITHIL